MAARKNHPEPIAPFMALALSCPEALEQLSDEELLLLHHMPEFWLLPHQYPPQGKWRYWINIGGRGEGKSFRIARWIVSQVAAGKITDLALMAQDEERSWKIQCAPLIEASPPWCAAEPYNETLRWANGAVATIYSPLEPDKPRGFNGQLAWLSEVVGWKRTSGREAFNNLLTATRVGDARIVIDTTSKGRVPIIEYMLKLHEADPKLYPLHRGSICDNPLLKREYLREQFRLYSGRRRNEELFGMVYQEAEGALWEQATLDDTRCHEEPPHLERKLIAIDPATTDNPDSDATGMVEGGIMHRKGVAHAYVVADHSGRMAPEEWAKMVIERHQKHKVVGCIIETNRGGKTNTSVLRAYALLEGISVRVLREGQRFPYWTSGIIYVRERHTWGTKQTRARGPAVAHKQGLVHHIGVLPDLEYEQTTYAPGTAESPNRYDASAMLIEELLQLESNKPQPSAGDAAALTEAAQELASEQLLIRHQEVVP